MLINVSIAIFFRYAAGIRYKLMDTFNKVEKLSYIDCGFGMQI